MHHIAVLIEPRSYRSVSYNAQRDHIAVLIKPRSYSLHTIKHCFVFRTQYEAINTAEHGDDDSRK